MKILLLLLAFSLSLLAIPTGELSLFILKDGKPLPQQKVLIYKITANQNQVDLYSKAKFSEFLSDEDGYINAILPQGKYQLQVLNKENGTPLAFVKKVFYIKAKKESQIIISLKADDSLLFTDSEAPTIDNNLSKQITQTQNKKIEYGDVQLNILSSDDNKPVKNARIFVKGLKIDSLSDAKGMLVLKVPVGEHTISIIHSDFSAQTLKVKVIANNMVMKSVELTPASLEMEEFVVLAPHVEGSVAAVIAQERNSDTVGNVLGSEQFSKSGDSSVASALKRVSGITIVGGKYVYVRGLGDRYSTVMLNDLHVPSPEPTKRVVPLDIFPTSVVQSITIQKSYTADIPASFGGGTVLIKSKDIPKDDDSFASLGLELLINNSTGESVTTNADNSIPLPDAALGLGNDGGSDEATQIVATNRALNTQNTTLAPGVKVEVSAGKSYKITDDINLGASGSLFYKNESSNDNVTYNKYFYDINTKKVFHDNETQSSITSLDTTQGGMINIGSNYYDHNKIKYTFFTTKQTKDRTATASIDYIGDTDDREKTYLEYVEKTLTTHQVSGTNDLRFSKDDDGYFDNLVIDWAYENSAATRNEPGTVEYNYRHETSGLNWDRKNWYYYFILDDQVQNYRADFTLPFEFNENKNYTKAGVFVYNKTRSFDSRRYNMRSTNFDDQSADIDSIYASDLQNDNLVFSPAYRDTDSYEASQDVTAFYLKQFISITHDLDLIASARYEDSSQQLSDAEATYDPLVTADLFPTLGLTYRFDNDDMQLRFAYAQSISRPDFREFSNSRYKDPITENIVFGNPDLKATYIKHLDLKYEWYLEGDQSFSFALFGKKFTNPIEKVIQLDDSQDNTFLETYQNADSATSYGFEVDYRKRFGFIDESLDNLLFATNFSFINSNIVLNQDPDNSFTSRLTSKERSMQGQSPYVANFTLGYDNSDTGDSALLLFNQIGPSIISLGTDENKDQYLQAFAKLDFVTQWKLNNYYFEKSDFTYSMKFKAINLLDSEQKITQGDLTTFSTKPGREFTLSVKISY